MVTAVPLHTDDAEGVAVTVGVVFTLIVVVAVFGQPFDVPVTV